MADELRRYRIAYEAGAPIVSDEHYDALLERVTQLSGGKALVLSEVGTVTNWSAAIPLPFWMGSLDKVVGRAATQKLHKTDPRLNLVVSDKLDGVSCLYVRRRGQSSLVTRGNGSTGQNVSKLMKYIPNLPDVLMPDHDVMVRGELVISRSTFSAHFSGEFSNMRNLVAGCVNSKVPRADVARQLTFAAYEMPSHCSSLTLSQQLGFLRAAGVVTVTYTVTPVPNVTYESLLSSYDERKRGGEFDIDGLVVAIDSTYELARNANPKHAFAFKDPSLTETSVVTVTAVSWDASRHGRLTPVASFEPVPLSGVMVGKATAHNYNFVNDLGIGVGAKINICRSGDVIPKILSVVQRAEAAAPDVPYRVDGPHAFRLEGIDPAKRLHHFLVALDVKNAGPAACVKLHEYGVFIPAHLVALSPGGATTICGTRSVADVPGDTRRAVANAPEWLLLSATGAFGAGIGDRILRAVADHYPNQRIDTLTADQFYEVDGIGRSRAQQITSGIRAATEYLSGLTVARAKTPATQLGQKLSGQRVVFTGVRDKELNKLIEEQGGSVVTGGKKATVLVVPSEDFKASAKSNDAIAAGARVMTAIALRDLITA